MPAGPRKFFPATLPLFLSIPLLSVPSSPSADIYRQTTSDGVEVFTDSPVEDQVRLIIRELEKRDGPEQGADKARSAGNRGRASLPVGGVVTSGYGLRSDPVDGLLRQHRGVDIAVPEATPVKAVASGRVAYSGTRSGYGNVVVLEHDGGLVTLYAHNAVNCVGEGQRVGADDVIALSGSTGRSTGPHLHFEVWKQGVNVTDSYLKNGTLFGKPASPSFHGDDELIRSIILADGSVLLTNIGLP